MTLTYPTLPDMYGVISHNTKLSYPTFLTKQLLCALAYPTCMEKKVHHHSCVLPVPHMYGVIRQQTTLVHTALPCMQRVIRLLGTVYYPT